MIIKHILIMWEAFDFFHDLYNIIRLFFGKLKCNKLQEPFSLYGSNLINIINY